jgi:hypothetical protein
MLAGCTTLVTEVTVVPCAVHLPRAPATSSPVIVQSSSGGPGASITQVVGIDRGGYACADGPLHAECTRSGGRWEAGVGCIVVARR